MQIEIFEQEEPETEEEISPADVPASEQKAEGENSEDSEK